MRVRTRPVGAILAGGGGRRIGGDKAIVELPGRPLICYPLEAVREALGQVAVLAKADTELPSLPGVTVWIEPDARRHPLVGITQALALADGRPVLVCAADLPFVSASSSAGSPGPIRAGRRRWSRARKDACSRCSAAISAGRCRCSVARRSTTRVR